MRLPRFRIRMLVIAVAVTSIACFGFDLWRKSKTYRARARYHSVEAFRIYVGPDHHAPLRVHRRNRARLKWHGDLESKYAFAASHPWFSVPPDPPFPE
jgi:hypothetical protein